jgi:hypothetical protein
MTAPRLTPEVCLDANRFVLENGRLPQLGRDPVPPWRYRGWQLYYAQAADMTPIGSGRWRWYLDAFERRRLPDTPIPRIEFDSVHHGGSAGLKMIEKAVDILFEDTGSWTALPRLVDWLSYSFGLVNEEPRGLSDKVQEKLYRHWNLEPLIKHPADYFGNLICEYKGGGWRNKSGFYPTPHAVVECMTRMVMADMPARMPDGRDPRIATVCDPCVGTGRMLMHASNYSLCLYGQDIDPLVCAVTKINGALYVPWMTFPFAQAVLDTGLAQGVYEGNSLIVAPDTPRPPSHRDVPPPPAPLPIPAEQYRLRLGYDPISAGIPMYRVDARGQGLLFTE